MSMLTVVLTFQELFMYDSAGKEIFSELVQKFVSKLYNMYYCIWSHVDVNETLHWNLLMHVFDFCPKIPSVIYALCPKSPSVWGSVIGKARGHAP